MPFAFSLQVLKPPNPEAPDADRDGGANMLSPRAIVPKMLMALSSALSFSACSVIRRGSIGYRKDTSESNEV